MAKSKQETVVSDEIVMTKILFIRGKKVMVDRDLAELYGVSTKRLNEQVKRNIKRFPVDFMFQLTSKEKEEVVAFCDHLGTLKYSSQLPYVFTEYGAVMLASVLNSDLAIEVNIQIVRIFTRMRGNVNDKSGNITKAGTGGKANLAEYGRYSGRFCTSPKISYSP